MNNDSLRSLRAYVLPIFRLGHAFTLVVFLISLAITSMVWLNERQLLEEEAQHLLQEAADDLSTAILQRVKSYEQILRGTGGLFTQPHPVSRTEFRDYVNKLELAETYPGILALGYNPTLQARDKAHFVQAMRQEGFADFAVRPSGERSMYAPVQFIEPFTGSNLRAFGYDTLTEPVRRAALEKARDSGKVAITDKLILAQNSDQEKQPGFLMFAPVYRHGSDISTVASRRANLLGWVSAPFRMRDLIAGLSVKQPFEVALQIYDGPEASAEQLIYSNWTEHDATVLNTSRQTSLAEHQWTLRFAAPSATEQLGAGKLNLVAVIGISISVLFTLLAGLMAYALQVSAKMTEQMTDKWQASQRSLNLTSLELEFKHGALNEHAIVSITDASGTITFVNDKFVEISGYSESELLGHNHRLLKSGIHPAEFYQAMWDTLVSGKTWHGEVCNRRKNGTLYWVRATIIPQLDENGLSLRYISIRTDVSELKQTQVLAQRNQLLLRNVIDTIPDLIFLKDKDGHYLGCNAAFERYFGAPEAHIVGKTDFNFVDESTAIFFRQQDTLMLASGQPRMNEETITYPDGHQVSIEMVKSPYHYGDDAPGVIGIGHDVTERKKQLQALHESDERWTFAVEGTGDGVWEWDMLNGKMLRSRINDLLLGYQENELPPTADAWVMCIHPDDLTPNADRLLSYLSGVSNNYVSEIRLRCKDGRYKWLLCRGTVVERDAEGKAIRMIGIHSDIDERKLAERQLALLGEMMENTAQPVFLIDVEEGYRLSYVNHAACQHWGASQAELLTWHVSDWDPTFDATRTTDYFAKMVGQPGTLIESEHRLKDGRVIPVEMFLNARMIAGKPYLYGSFQNITERKKNEESLRLFKRIFNSTDQAIGVGDSQGHLVFINPAHERLHRWRQEEVVGKHFSLFLTDEALASAPAIIETAMKEGSWEGLLPRKRSDGSEFMSSCHINVLMDNHGQPQYLFNILWDYTEELNRQTELRLARDAALAASKTRSDFLASMSHELRTPMNAILGFTQLLEGDQSCSPDQKENLQQISKAGWHLLDLINEVLDLARVESGEVKLTIQDLNTADVVTECLTLVSPLLAPKQITIENRVKHNVPKVLADFMRLKQVLINLLSNAIKYNREQGRVIIEVSTEGDQMLLLSVRDTGNGMTTDQLQHLFEPFTRFGNLERTQSTGIGLSISKKLIERMNGKIRVVSEPSKGSTFTVALPIGTGISTRQTTPGNGLHLLYIEDDVAHQALLDKWASKLQWTIEFANDAASGIDAAMKERYDAILLDVDLPGGFTGMDVKSVFDEQESLRDIPVIGISNLVAADDVKRGMQAGFVAYLTKPVDLKELERVIQTAVRGSV